MRDTFIHWCDRVIRYGIYALFFFVPLIVTNTTSELYELNKMWFTWEVTIFIVAAWVSKMILQGKFSVQRTPLDIPILLFLLSQIISTVISIDPHTSFWGYYSRFNGGLLSTITYSVLYYAVATNLRKEHILNILKVTLASALIVALWGLPSHFGKDPTCLLFRGSLDVECWTDAFKPTIRIFSTLGQPAWMSAYMNIVIPVATAFSLLLLPIFSKKQPELSQTERNESAVMSYITSKNFLIPAIFVILFFICLIFTNTRAGIIAFWLGNVVFWLTLFIKRYFTLKTFFSLALLFNSMFLLAHFFFGTSFAQLDAYTLPALTTREQTQSPPQTAETAVQDAPGGGTDSGKIRQIVWQGAIDVWKANPIFGSGVETFAYSYYLHRPADHNLTSEWDYLYNKAHNEYLNYLATTGSFGLVTYVLLLGVFLFITLRYLLKKKSLNGTWLITLSLVTSYITILVTNFFGFSVVITNLYLFLIPVFIFILEPELLKKKPVDAANKPTNIREEISGLQWTGVTFTAFIGVFLLLMFMRFWYADKAYALGSNLSNVQEYQQAYLSLGEAVNLRPSEPVFRDEFALNNAMIATLLLIQEAEATPSAETIQQAQILSEQSITISNELVTDHPNNITFWKNRVRLFYTLTQADRKFLPYAIDAVEQVRTLAPTDAKVMYNLGALYQENNNPEKSAETLEKTILLKPDYRDAYFALALAYNEMAVDENNVVVNPDMRKKAIRQLEFILDRLSPNDTEAIETLSAWQNTGQ